MIELLPQFRQLAIALLICVVATVIYKRFFTSRLPLPPGPPRYPIIGNIIPGAFTYRYFEKLAQEFGPVFSLRLGLRTVIVVGRVDAAMQIMEKDGAITADRPRNIAAGETLSGGMRVMFEPFGDKFKIYRKALHAHLDPRVVSTYQPVFMKNAKQHVLDIISAPERHQDHAKKYAVSVVLALAYGKSVGADDPLVRSVTQCLKNLGNALRPGYWQVESFPFLRYIPGYLKELQDGYALEKGVFVSQLDHVRKQLTTGDEVPSSFGKYLLERQKELQLEDVETAYLAGGIFGAGSDTTAAAISIAIMAAAKYPETQQKVWDELQSVIGTERPPRPTDKDQLPQTMAFVLETFRWRPVTAGGFAHKVMKDIIWNGHLIPKGASIFGNIWGVGRDPQYFPDPERFNPQRWLKDGKLRDDLRVFNFGWGRRQCPGHHMATSSVFLNTALVFWAFKIFENPDYPIDDWAFTESANTHPEPFKVAFEPRFAPDTTTIKDMLEDYGL